MLNQGRNGGLPQGPPRHAPASNYSRSSDGSDVGMSMGQNSIQRYRAGAYDAPPQSGGRPPGFGQQLPVRSHARSQLPDGQMLLNGYRDDIKNRFHEPTHPNPKNAVGSRSSQSLDVHDPVMMHLLVEDALSEAKEYELSAPEVVDEWKKQIKICSRQRRQIRETLIKQCKCVDAARSVGKLYLHPGKQDFGQTDTSDAAELERAASERECEELAVELWNIDKRLMGLQIRVLKHTAGTLQMTHIGLKKIVATNASGPPKPGGIPSSSDSVYNYQNRYSGVEIVEDNFLDERNFYREAVPSNPYNPYNGIRNVDGLPDAPSLEQLQLITKTESKLEDFNKRMRQLIVKTNPRAESECSKPPSKKSHGRSDSRGISLQNQLDYMEKGLAELDRRSGQNFKKHKESEAAMEETLEELNREVRNVLLPYDPNRPEPPKLSGTGLEQQLLYFEDSVNSVEMELARAANVSNRNIGNQENIDQMETVLVGLWDMIQAGQHEIVIKKQQRLQKELATGVKEEEVDSDEDEGEDDPNEPFSLPAFSTKFRWLYSRSTKLREQKKALQGQLTQQREANIKADASKVAELQERTRELEQLKQQQNQTRQANTSKDNELEQKARDLARKVQQLEEQDHEIDDLRHELKTARSKLEEAQNDRDSLSKNRASEELTRQALRDELAVTERELTSLKLDRESTSQAQAKLARSNTEIASLKAELATAQEATSRLEAAESKIVALKSELADASNSEENDLTEAEDRIADLTADLAEAASATQIIILEREKAVRERDKALKNVSLLEEEGHQALKDKENEMETLQMEIARLQTEVTIARAELDGAYGTRAQRAAEVASNPAMQREIDNLSRKNAELMSRLAGVASAPKEDGKMDELKTELKETIEEYEVMTKASVQWEREREDLERMVDRLREEKEQLEERLDEEKVRWLDVTSPTLEGQSPGAQNTSTTVLRTEFKRMVRDMRAKSQSDLKEAQAERRKLELENRALKRTLGHGKSGLSQSTIS